MWNEKWQQDVKQIHGREFEIKIVENICHVEMIEIQRKSMDWYSKALSSFKTLSNNSS